MMGSFQFAGRSGPGRAAMVVVAALLTLGLSGCGSSAATPTAATPTAAPTTAASAGVAASPTPVVTPAPGTETLHVLIPASGLQVGFQAVAKNFMAVYPTITVDFQAVTSGTTYSQTLLTQLQAGTAPDVIYTNGGSGAPEAILQLANANRLADLSGRSWASSLPAAATSLYVSGNKVYGLPLDLNPLGVVYNVDQFTALGLTVPTTFSQLLDLCKTIKAKGKVPIAVPGMNPRLLGEMLAANYVYSTDPDWNSKRAAGSVTFANTPGWATAVQSYADMNNAGCFTTGVQSVSVSQSFTQVGSGQALMYTGPASGMGSIQAIDKTMHLAMFPLPGATAAATRVMAGYYDALAVNSASKYIDDAERLVDFFSKSDQQSVFASAAGGISIADAASGTFPSQFSLLAPLFTQKLVVSRAQDSWPNALMVSALDSALVGAITGQLSIDAGLASLDAAWAKGLITPAPVTPSPAASA